MLPALVLALLCGARPGPQAPLVTTAPAPREDARWLERHAKLVERAHQFAPEIVFVGDSITEGWEGAGAAEWRRRYGPRAANFGIGGDRTQHVLWRIESLRGLAPKLAVVMIGTNNAWDDPPEAVAAGVEAVVARLREILPRTRVLLLSIFPRGERPDDPLRQRVAAIDALLAPIDARPGVELVDLGEVFLESDGSLAREVMPDFLHLSAEGYRRWGEALAPWLAEALAAEPLAGVTPDERMGWWRQARFGLFVHWGLYSLLEGEWEGRTDHAEWIRTTARIPLERYEELVGRFDPTRFDAGQWTRAAAEAGMRYIVITSKHHDGFCLWDSAQGEFDVGATPFGARGREPLAELARASRERGLAFGLYHSILDWHHPDWLPRLDWEQRSAEGAEPARYRATLHAQVAELVARFHPSILWFDGEWETSWTHADGLALASHVRALDPHIVMNNRVDKGRTGMGGASADARFAGDFATPEQEVPALGFPALNGTPVDWESCLTLNDHWGWNRADQHWKSVEELVRTLADVASKGGNLLLNVGPEPDGSFPAEALERLRGIGAWMRTNGEAIHGTSAGPFSALAFGRATLRALDLRGEKRTRLYLFVLDWPADGRLVVPLEGARALTAQLLGAEGTLAVSSEARRVVVTLPARPDSPLPVVALELAGARVAEALEPWPARELVAHEPGLVRTRYEGEWTRLPELDALEPSESALVSELGPPPGFARERVAFLFEGYLRVPDDGPWRFELVSDDGARLWIDGRRVVDADGLHVAEARVGRAPLAAGWHALRVEWFNRTGEAALGLRLALGEGALLPVPASALAHATR